MIDKSLSKYGFHHLVDPLFILLVDNDHDELKSWLEGEGPPGENPKLFLFQVQLRRPTTILLMIAHLGKIPTLRKTSLISASICTTARAPLVKATSSHKLKKIMPPLTACLVRLLLFLDQDPFSFLFCSSVCTG